MLWDVEETTPLFEKSRGRDPGGVANISWTGWVICKETKSKDNFMILHRVS